MTLRALQHDYYQAMQGNDSALKARVQGAGDLSTEQALAVYRNNTEQTLLSVLQQSFAVCRMLVGERCFNQLALRYCRTHPSSSLDLNAYGELFPRLHRSAAGPWRTFTGGTLSWRYGAAGVADSARIPCG